MRKLLLAACVAALPAALTTSAQAQTYPSKPIRLVLTVAGGVENAVRVLTDKMGSGLGQPVVVDPQSAAGGAVGANMVARAAPDGYTITYATTSAMVLRPFLTKNTPYDTLKDFTPISMVGEAVACLVASSSLPVNTVPELIAYAKANPGKISYGSSGIGTTHHLSGEVMSQLTGIKMVHIPYKSGGQSMTDLITGQVQITFGVLASAGGFVDSGKIKLLAINGPKRYYKYPNTPTVLEALPGYDRPSGWMAFFGPAGMSQPITRRLHAEIIKGMNDPQVAGMYDKFGLMVQTSESPEAFAAEVRTLYAKTGQLVKAAGIQPE
jgi:tripartite-type tricarboxylate transporter receptor subunit TctC